MSISRRMDKKAVVHIHNGVLLSYKKNAFESVLMRWKRLDPIIQSEVSQKEKEQYNILTHISAGKESACNVGDLGLIPGLERFPGEEKGYLLQYSGLENSVDCIVMYNYGVAKSQTRLSDFHFVEHEY